MATSASAPKTPGKRQFPPEWYAKQAARRKNKNAASATASAASSAATKAPAKRSFKGKNFKASNVSIVERNGKDGTNHNYVTFKGNGGLYSRQQRFYQNVSEASMNRLKKVLAARQKAGNAQNATSAKHGTSNGYTQGKRSQSVDKAGTRSRVRTYALSNKSKYWK